VELSEGKGSELEWREGGELERREQGVNWSVIKGRR